MAHVALLRGINLGGKNRIAMAKLVEIFESAGCSRVSTYIQSGNVIFDPPPSKKLDDLAVKLAKKILDETKLTVPVVLRTAAELAAIPTANPFPSAPEDHLHVAFLADAPTAELVAKLDPARSPGDSFRVVARDLFLHLPKGVAHTKLTNVWFDKQLATTSTVRNWRTVTKLIELSA